MMKVFIDTDVIIDFTYGENSILKKLLTKQFQCKIQLVINPVVIAEFFTDKKMQDETKMAEMKELFGFFTPLEITTNIGFKAAELLRHDTTLALGDALIAATCVTQNIELATRNKKHFAKVRDLQFWQN